MFKANETRGVAAPTEKDSSDSLALREEQQDVNAVGFDRLSSKPSGEAWYRV
jgi:hypothetical protein